MKQESISYEEATKRILAVIKDCDAETLASFYEVAFECYADVDEENNELIIEKVI